MAQKSSRNQHATGIRNEVLPFEGYSVYCDLQPFQGETKEDQPCSQKNPSAARAGQAEDENAGESEHRKME